MRGIQLPPSRLNLWCGRLSHRVRLCTPRSRETPTVPLRVSDAACPDGLAVSLCKFG